MPSHYPAPDTVFLLQDLIVRLNGAFGTSNNELSSARLVSHINIRLQSAANTDQKTALKAVFLEILSTCDRLANQNNDPVSKSLLGSSIPLLFKSVKASEHLVVSQEEFTNGLEEALSEIAAVATNDFFFPTFCTMLVRQSVISSAFALSLNRSKITAQNFTPTLDAEAIQNQLFLDSGSENVTSVIKSITQDVYSQQLIIQGIQNVIESWSESLDLSSLASICGVLLENTRALSIMFLYIDPSAILAPIRRFLETFAMSDNPYGDEPPTKQYGTIIFFLQCTLARFQLYADLPRHLGTSSGFFIQWLPSISATYEISTLSDVHKSAINGWISGLFGEGISDDLTVYTSPQVLLHCAPTIFKQCVVATQLGVFEVDTLKEGFSYFLQDILNFTLPGVMFWLLDYIKITSIPEKQQLLYEILEYFIFSETFPAPVLELIGKELAILHDQLSKMPSSPSINLEKLKQLLDRFDCVEKTQITWKQRLSSEVSSAIHGSGAEDPLLNIPHSLTHALQSSSTTSIVNTVLDQLSSASSIPTDPHKITRIEQLASSVLGYMSSSSSRLYPLLYLSTRTYLTNHVNRGNGKTLGKLMRSAFRPNLELEVILGGEQVKNLEQRVDIMILQGREIESEQGWWSEFGLGWGP